MLGKIAELLRQDNMKKLEDGIIDIILAQIQSDFSGLSEYILDPDDVTEFVEKCKEKAFKNIEAELIAKMEGDMRKSLSLQNNE